MDTINDVWKEVLALCKGKVSDITYNMWLAPLEPAKFENDTFIFVISSEFKKTIVMDKFSPILKEAFEKVMGFPVEIDILVNYKPTETGDEKDGKKENDGNKESETAFTFENFIEGKSNSLAYNASLGVVDDPGSKNNPLLIYGRSGLGKTHLLLAIENALRAKYPNMIVIYTTCEDLINELLVGMRMKNTVPFREKYRNADALLVDDVQFIQKGEAFQEEFFHTFDTLNRAGKQIVMTSDEPPRNMPILSERLRSRFEMGVLADIQPPDYETRKVIIYKKSEELGMTLKDDVVEFIAQSIKNNVRQLEGTVHKIYAMQQTFHHELTVPEIENIVKDITTDSQPISITVDKIIDYVSNAFGVTVADIKSDKRQNNIKLARQTAMYVIKEVTSLTLQEIGDIFGKNHSTVLYSVDQIRNNMSKYPEAKVVADSAIKEFKKD